MSKQKNKPWDEKWEIVKPIGGGGQGDTFLVKPKDSTILSQSFVLKKLKNQKDAERRKRMHREVAALSTLDCPGIPRLIESNSDQFDSDVPLYMIGEFIEGKTLSQILDPAPPMGIADAVNLVLKLLETIQYCHKLGIVHRDIKPDNIIMRRDNIADPVVIDFGISFNESDADGTILTPALAAAWQPIFSTSRASGKQQHAARPQSGYYTMLWDIIFCARRLASRYFARLRRKNASSKTGKSKSFGETP
jgi:serine/threonine-protein kinase